MEKWIARQKKHFDNETLNKRYSNQNWVIHKKEIKDYLEGITELASKNGVKLIFSDYSTEVKGFGYDGLSIQFDMSFTGNMIELKEKDSTVFNYHKQIGSVLNITFSGTGKVQVFLDPSTSEDSKAVHNYLLIYYTSNAKNITTKMIDRWLKCLFSYQRVTGVLHTPSFYDKFTVCLCKVKSFMMMYDTPEAKFKRYSAIYIPGVTLLVTILVFILTIYTLALQMNN